MMRTVICGPVVAGWVIRVELPNGNVLQYNHTSKSYLAPGDKVTPETRLGKTGGVGAGGRIHLHLQAMHSQG